MPSFRKWRFNRKLAKVKRTGRGSVKAVDYAVKHRIHSKEVAMKKASAALVEFEKSGREPGTITISLPSLRQEKKPKKKGKDKTADPEMEEYLRDFKGKSEK